MAKLRIPFVTLVAAAAWVFSINAFACGDDKEKKGDSDKPSVMCGDDKDKKDGDKDPSVMCDGDKKKDSDKDPS